MIALLESCARRSDTHVPGRTLPITVNQGLTLIA